MERKKLTQRGVIDNPRNLPDLNFPSVGSGETAGSLQRNRLAAPEAVRRRETAQVVQQAPSPDMLQAESVPLAHNQPEEGVVIRNDGVFKQVHRAKDSASFLMKWHTPILVDTYAINNPDGMQTLFTQKNGVDGLEGVYQEQYSVATKRGKRKLLSREKVGEEMEFTPQRNPDGSIAKSESYKGELRIFSASYIEKDKELESAVENESFAESVDRLQMQFIPLAEPRSNHIESLHRLQAIQAGLSMVKDSPKEQAILGLQTFTVSTLSSAFVFGVPIAGPLGIVKNVGDFAVVTEAYQLLRAPSMKDRIKDLPWNLAKNVLSPFTMAYSIVQRLQNNTKDWVAGRKAVQEYQKLHPYISDKKALRVKMESQAHSEWLDALQYYNPNIPKDVIGIVAQKYISERNQQLLSLKKDSDAIIATNMIPAGVYLASLGITIVGSFLLGGGVPLIVAGLIGSTLSGISRPIVNYTKLRSIKERIQKERPYELQPVAEIIRELQEAS